MRFNKALFILNGRKKEMPSNIFFFSEIALGLKIIGRKEGRGKKEKELGREEGREGRLGRLFTTCWHRS